MGPPKKKKTYSLLLFKLTANQSQICILLLFLMMAYD